MVPPSAGGLGGTDHRRGAQMGGTRRGFLRAAVPATAGGAAGSTEPVLAQTASAASPPGDVVGKITVGYQGWFACIGDGAPTNAWWQWAQNWGQIPSPSNNS